MTAMKEPLYQLDPKLFKDAVISWHGTNDLHMLPDGSYIQTTTFTDESGKTTTERNQVTFEHGDD